MNGQTRITSARARKAVFEAARVLENGGVVAYPTETSYALGCDATNAPAVKKIFALKKRSRRKPLPLIVDSLKTISRYALLNEKARVLAKKFMPGPLTLVVEMNGAALPKRLSPGGIAFRISSNKFAYAIAKKFGKPIVSTSANKSGEPSIYSSRKIVSEYGGKVDLVVDAGELAPEPPSAIVDLRGRKPVLLRKGPVKFVDVVNALKKMREKRVKLVVGKGAEAELFEAEWNARPALRKIRASKSYRAPALDLALRRKRTRREAKALRVARENGVPVPELFFENEEKFELVVEKLEGVLLSRKKVSLEEAERAGEILAKLHAAGIVHGDYSTSNLIAADKKSGKQNKAGKVFAIDFGLSEFSRSVEERADDAIVFEKSLDNAALAQGFRHGYSRGAGVGEAETIFSRMKQILSRARYARSAL